MLYNVLYKETYKSNYLIEADSEEEARDMLYEGIENGSLDGPDECDDSYAFVSKAKVYKGGN